MAAAGASGGDGNEKQTSAAATSAAANLKPTAAGSSGEVGRAAPGTVAAIQESADATAATANLKLAAACAGDEDGRAALRDIPWPAWMAPRRNELPGRSCRAVLYACCKEAN